MKIRDGPAAVLGRISPVVPLENFFWEGLGKKVHPLSQKTCFKIFVMQDTMVKGFAGKYSCMPEYYQRLQDKSVR